MRTSLTLMGIIFLIGNFLTIPLHAAETVSLSVRATAVTGSCSPSLDTPEVNFGKINYTTLNPSAPTSLPEKMVRLVITCTSPMAVGWRVTDNRADSVAHIPVTLKGHVYNGTSLAGLGKTPAGASLGNWVIRSGQADSVQYDGQQGVAVSSSDNGATWKADANTPVSINFGGDIITSVSHTTGSVPIPFSNGIFALGISGVIAPRNTLKLTDTVSLDGSATFTLVYL